MSFLRGRGLELYGGGALAVGLLVNLRTLKKLPDLFVDEPVYASTAWSFASGNGLKPSLALGSGVYDGVTDYWSARIGSIPHVIGDLLFGTSFEVYRGVTFLVAALAVVVLVIGLRRLLPTGLALLAAAALSVSWGFVVLSHWIRWDAMVMLVLATILLLLVARSPRPLAAAAAGALIGICPDFAIGVAATFPAVLVLCAWESDGRRQRVTALLGGVVAGFVLYLLLHFTGGDLGAARDQYEASYERGYDGVPIVNAVTEFSLEPLLDESERYELLGYAPGSASFLTLALGSLAAILTIVRGLGVAPAPLRLIGLVGLVGLPLVMALTPAPHDAIRPVMAVLIAAGAALLAICGARALKGAGPYPREAIPALLLVSMLAGFVLLVGVKGHTYIYVVMPFAISAIAVALSVLSPDRHRVSVPVVGLTAILVISGAHTIAQTRTAIYDPALDPGLSREARDLVPEGSTVMGEPEYWWLFRDERYRYNLAVTHQLGEHPDDSFADSFHRVCPDFVLLDDLARESLEQRSELAPMLAVLRGEYRVVRREGAAGRDISYWQRKLSCPPPGAPAASS